VQIFKRLELTEIIITAEVGGINELKGRKSSTDDYILKKCAGEYKKR
jgi:hypothetical protein